MEIAKNGLREF